MARRRMYGEDLTYAEAHRFELEHLYRRVGHRLDMADRDWTEFCHWCKEPLAIIEEVRDRGQDLHDKATTVTRKLAKRAGICAMLLAVEIERPRHVEREIEQHQARIRELEQAYPIQHVTAKLLEPNHGRKLVRMTLDEWWLQGVYMLHVDHHRNCRSARQSEHPEYWNAIKERIGYAKEKSRLWPVSRNQISMFS